MKQKGSRVAAFFCVSAVTVMLSKAFLYRGGITLVCGWFSISMEELLRPLKDTSAILKEMQFLGIYPTPVITPI